MEKGFYKQEENGNWLYTPNKVQSRDYTLDENNKTSIDGWIWYDEEPEEYKIWKEEQENNFNRHASTKM